MWGTGLAALPGLMENSRVRLPFGHKLHLGSCAQSESAKPLITPALRLAQLGRFAMLAAIRRASSLALWPECRLGLETMHRRQRNCARLPKRFRQSRIDRYAPQRGNGRAVLFHRRISEGEEDKGFLETHILVISQSH
jgi:hypothetical protein